RRDFLEKILELRVPGHVGQKDRRHPPPVLVPQFLQRNLIAGYRALDQSLCPGIFHGRLLQRRCRLLFIHKDALRRPFRQGEREPERNVLPVSSGIGSEYPNKTKSDDENTRLTGPEWTANRKS